MITSTIKIYIYIFIDFRSGKEYVLYSKYFTFTLRSYMAPLRFKFPRYIL